MVERDDEADGLSVESPRDCGEHRERDDPAELSERFQELLRKVEDRDVRFAVQSVLVRAARAMESDKRYRLRLRAEEKLRAEAEARAEQERARAEEIEARLSAVADAGATSRKLKSGSRFAN